MLHITVLMKRNQVNIRLSAEEEAKLQRILTRTGAQKASVVKKYLKLGLDWEDASLDKFTEMLEQSQKGDQSS